MWNVRTVASLIDKLPNYISPLLDNFLLLLHRLFITDAPIVSLSLGQPLNPNKLMNGSDVYLECDVKANPGIKKVEWFHNVGFIQSNARISAKFHAPFNVNFRKSNYTRRVASSFRIKRWSCRPSRKHRMASTCAGRQTPRAPCPAMTCIWMWNVSGTGCFSSG